MNAHCVLRPRPGSVLPRLLLVALVVWPTAWLGATQPQPEPVQVTLYELEHFAGRHFTTHKRMGNLERTGFSERVASLVVTRGRWEVCDATRYRGHCTVLVPGQYPSLQTMGMSQRVSSVRIVAGSESIAACRYSPGEGGGASDPAWLTQTQDCPPLANAPHLDPSAKEFP